MAFWPRGSRAQNLPFTRDQYEAVRGLVAGFLSDPDFGLGTEDDEKQRRILDVFVADGLLPFDRLSSAGNVTPVESKLAHDVAAAIAHDVTTTADAHPMSTEASIAAMAAGFVSLKQPVGHQSDDFAVYRAEKTLLEATCRTFLRVVIEQGTQGNFSRTELEALAQSIGLIWLQWFTWNEPYSWAAHKGVEQVP